MTSTTPLPSCHQTFIQKHFCLVCHKGPDSTEARVFFGALGQNHLPYIEFCAPLYWILNLFIQVSQDIDPMCPCYWV